MVEDIQAIGNAGVAALRRGDGAMAKAAFDRIEASGHSTHQLRLLRAQACAMINDGDGAHHALDQVLAAEPTNLYALILRGDLHQRRGDDRAAVTWYQAALAQAPRAGKLPPDLIDTLRRVERAVDAAGARFEEHLDSALTAAGVVPGRAGARFAEAREILAGRAPIQLQQPTSFYYPRLPQQPFFERADFPWIAAIEAAAPAIRAELEAVIAQGGGFSPYVQGDPDRPTKRHPLLDDPQWSAFHLLRGGAPVADNAARCPATMAALASAPIPVISGRSPMALFSVLGAGTHIPPHNGMLNTRLICHIPLIVSDGCRLRVGNETRVVERDVALLFDDSIEHEAWNDSDATRVVLLFEIWRPELDAAERAALTALFEAIGSYAPIGEDQAGA